VLETTNGHASGLAASRVGGPRSHWPRPCARCLRQTSIRVGAHLCPRGTAGRSTTICIRPLAIRRSLVPGRPFCPAAASRQARLYIGRPDQSSTRRYRRFTLFALPALLLPCAKLCLPGEAESALQACNRRGIPRPTAHQRCQAPEATVSGAVFFALTLLVVRRGAPCPPVCLQAAGFFTLR